MTSKAKGRLQKLLKLPVIGLLSVGMFRMAPEAMNRLGKLGEKRTVTEKDWPSIVCESMETFDLVPTEYNDYVCLEDSVLEDRGWWFDAGMSIWMYAPGTVKTSFDLSQLCADSISLDTIGGEPTMVIRWPAPSIADVVIRHSELHTDKDEWGTPGLSNEARHRYNTELREGLLREAETGLIEQALARGVLDDAAMFAQATVPQMVRGLGFSGEVVVEIAGHEESVAPPGVEQPLDPIEPDNDAISGVPGPSNALEDDRGSAIALARRKAR